ncbi:MAG: TIGR04283 family arsenosugar biosynthesis glycosyltransferase [Candidatus Pelagadaptatus aseana]|uniref:TIGR04283 family arsenosugar biosynthesis glycosyltransferase n=1 Tax=Candidatus Pelagadaptatus aseana TaxID=3120508 RepID=UPI0039B31D78
MSLSIIVPCLNEADGIESTLILLQPLRISGVEVVVVDGGSADDTVSKASGLADQIFLSPPGRALQMNAGARMASGEYLLFLHADTRLPDQFLVDYADWQSKQAPWGFFPVSLSGSHWMLTVVAWFMNRRSQISAIATGDQCLFVRRDVWMELQGFAEIPLMEDIDLCRRLKSRRPFVARHRVTTSSRRWEENGIFKTIRLMWWLRWRFYWGADPAELKKSYR